MAHKRILVGVTLALGVTTASSMAQADVIASINGQSSTMAWGDGQYVNDSGAPLVVDPTTGSSLTIDRFDSNSDPFLSFVTGAKDTSVGGSNFNTVFNVLLATPLVTGDSYSVSGSLGVTITNGAPGVTATITPAGPTTPPFILDEFVANSTDGGATFFDACTVGVDIGTQFDTSSSSTNTLTKSFAGSNTYTANGTCGNQYLIAQIDYNGSGGNANYGLTGDVDLEPVAIPEPMSAALLGGAFLGLVGIGRRCKSA